MSSSVQLLIGTTKGLWRAKSNVSRSKFEVEGPVLKGHEVYGLGHDPRNSRVLAGINSMHFGSVVTHSDDLGATFTEPEAANVKFPEGEEWKLKRIWQLQAAGADEPDVVYAGAEPASLWKSTDRGVTFDLVRGLYDHPHRPQWQPGNGGLCLHTIIIHPSDPKKIFIAISAAGVYTTSDGGDTWNASNKGIKAIFLPEDEQEPEFGQCVHKIALNPSRPDTLYLQNHWGLYRSDDAAQSWSAIENGVPSTFGFPIVAHPHKPETAYVFPLTGDFYRISADAKCRVYRTDNGGKSWVALTDGLPQDDANVTVIRDAMTADHLDPAGIYFGTRTGEVYASNNDGDSWQLVASHLPPVLNIKVAHL